MALALPGIAVGAIGVWLYAVHVPTLSEVRAAYVSSDAWLLDRHGEVLDSRRIRMDVRRLAWTPLEQVSPAFVAALTSGEDRRFATHAGVDWKSMAGAVRDELWFGRRRGASTITMQVARLLRPAPRAHGIAAFTEKLGQVRAALALERHWSKHDILEAYVNLLGYQGEVQGIAAATARLLDKGPEALSGNESVALAALLPDPDAPRATLERRACARGRTLEPQVSCAGITLAVDAMLARRLPTGNDAHWAPQLAHRLLTVPGERRVTTIDARLQALAVKSVSGRLATLSTRNVRDGAAIVVDNATGEVLAYVGSAGLNSRSREVDGVQALRQAGSTLKPFLYELALERRYLTAASLLNDAPLSLDTASGVYIPQDYEHDFKGPVSVRTALAGSLNIPAVRTLVLVGVDPFLERLRALGYADIRQDANFYGFALALGSAEVSLWQQAAAYRALASDGIVRSLTLTPAQDPGAGRPVLAKDASFVIGDILADPQARAITFGLDNQLKTPHWSAAKTGTSEDMRDNWCVGFSTRYTVAVWVGNFEGDSMHEVSGVSGAAPIWHDLMVALDSTADVSPTPPPSVESRSVRFAPRVESERREWFLRGADAGYATVGQADTVVQDGGQPAIQNPANGVVIALDPDIPEASQKVLLAASSADASMRLRLNDVVIGAAATPHLWTPKAGAYRLTLEDANGRAVDHVLFTVRGSGI
jgi:penicillin-binding protein 1C